jgi:hypothetical protein
LPFPFIENNTETVSDQRTMKTSKSDPGKTILTISMGFTIVYLTTKWNWAIAVSLLAGLIGISSTYLSGKVDFLWTKLSEILGLIVPKILLAAVFYLFLFPIAVLSKVFGKKDPLLLKNNCDSLFVTPKKAIDRASFEKPW